MVYNVRGCVDTIVTPSIQTKMVERGGISCVTATVVAVTSEEMEETDG